MNQRHVALVLRRELLDLRRQRRVFRRLFLQPLVFVALLGAPALLIQRVEARERSSEITVAVEGDLDALDGLADSLDAPPLRVLRTDDAARRLTTRAAEVGVVIPSGAGAAVAEGRPAPLDVLTFSTQDASERAGPAVLRRLSEYAREASERVLVASGAPRNLATPLTLAVDDVATTSPEGIRFGLAQALPVLLVIQLFGLTSVAEERLAGAKDRRTLEPLLLLPFRRSEVLAGVGIGSATIGALSALLVFVPLTLLVSTAVASIGRSLVGPFEITAAIATGAAGLALAFMSLGLLLGARASSTGEGSVFVVVAQVSVFAVVAASPFLTRLAAEGPILLVPVLGSLLLVRDGIGEGLQASDVALVLAGAAVTSWLLGRAALRRIGDERSVLRSTR